MKKLIFKILALIVLAIFIPLVAIANPSRYVGGDVSLLLEYEGAGAKYKDNSGRPIEKLMPWLADQGMNAMRVRLFVNPAQYKKLHSADSNEENRYDPNACQDLEYILPICKEIKEAGMALMLDFHYSDTWADPAKQWTPIDWRGLSDEELYDKIYDYTKETLLTLKEEGITPDFIQTGNEISYGMLWGQVGTSSPKKTLMGSDENWERLATLLQRAGAACHEVCPDAKIVIHTERVAQVNVLKNFYDKMRTLNVDYDIIGLSYYPYFHGDMEVLDNALATLQSEYSDKEIMIVETGYPYKWAVPGTTHDLQTQWPYSDAGQNKFAVELISTLEKYDHCTGLFWWWLEYNAFGTTLSGWYNAPLFDSTTGRATSALTTLCSFAKESSVTQIDEDGAPASLYDLQGRQLKHRELRKVMIENGRKIVVR